VREGVALVRAQVALVRAQVAPVRAQGALVREVELAAAELVALRRRVRPISRRSKRDIALAGARFARGRAPIGRPTERWPQWSSACAPAFCSRLILICGRALTPSFLFTQTLLAASRARLLCRDRCVVGGVGGGYLQ
jgi:hypothetical protein